MKKLTRSNKPSPRKLSLRHETIAVLRQLSNHELRDGGVAGASAPQCKDSPPTIFSGDDYWC
jgi:hypothetical protein